MRSTKVFLADAGSTDGTQELAMSFTGRLDIEVIPGGLPSVGRNAGAGRAITPYVLFIDADMELKDPTLLRRTMSLAGSVANCTALPQTSGAPRAGSATRFFIWATT